MSDRSAEVVMAVQTELTKHNDVSSVRVRCLEDGNEELYLIYLHKPMADKFYEFHLFTTFDEPVKVPSYSEMWK